jgi:DNA-binding NarL/FixJ family response regulator
MQIRVLIVDDEKHIRETLSDMLGREPGITVVGTAGDPQEAVILAKQALPDVALLDVRMPGGGGTAAAEGIHRVSPETKMIALSAQEDASSVVEMHTRGVGEYIVKDSPAGQIVDAIRRAGSATSPS